MSTAVMEGTIQTLDVTKEEYIEAPIHLVFEAVLEQMGPLNETPDGKPLVMKLEPWPGGRWYRDLGNNSGHFWGNVQAIKSPELLEICGPLFMSTPAISNVQYRLVSEGSGTLLKFSHKAAGWIDEPLRDGVNVHKGWGSLLTRVASAATDKHKGENK